MLYNKVQEQVKTGKKIQVEAAVIYTFKLLITEEDHFRETDALQSIERKDIESRELSWIVQMNSDSILRFPEY